VELLKHELTLKDLCDELPQAVILKNESKLKLGKHEGSTLSNRYRPDF